MSTDHLTLSIIMPVFNAEKYIETSLESYCRDKYKNLEILCINDGSTDKTLDILKNFAKQDSRIKIIEQFNQGPGAARQKGLNMATGDYIWFVDADDTCDEHAVDIILSTLKKYTTDILYFGTNLINEKVKKFSSSRYYALSNIHKSRINQNLSINRNAYILFNLPRELWNKVYRKNFLIQNNINFCPDITLYDDILFTTSALLKSSNVLIIKDILYNYHMNNENSIMSTAQNRLDGIFHYFNKIYNYLQEHDYSRYIKRTWLLKEICSMNYWLTRENIDTSLYYKKLYELYSNIKDEIYMISPCDTYQYKNIKTAIQIINNSYAK